MSGTEYFSASTSEHSTFAPFRKVGQQLLCVTKPEVHDVEHGTGEDVLR